MDQFTLQNRQEQALNLLARRPNGQFTKGPRGNRGGRPRVLADGGWLP